MSFRIALVSIDELKPHEEVIEPAVGSLANDVLNEGMLRDPLVVDQEYYVILDGMHRFSSLKQLKCRFVPCCLVDYDSPQIKVGGWFRLFAAQDGENLAEKLLKDAGLNYARQHVDLASPRYGPQTIILTRGISEFSLPEPMDPIQRARTAVSLEKTMVKMGHAVTYQPETVALQKLRSSDMDFIISVPIFTKEQIREFGVEGHLLPHKVTRHVMPSRPLGVDIPIQMLTDRTISLDEANRKLGELLAQRHIDRKPPGSVVDGRRYEEELLIFTR
jgi:hypothetical protein